MVNRECIKSPASHVYTVQYLGPWPPSYPRLSHVHRSLFFPAQCLGITRCLWWCLWGGFYRFKTDHNTIGARVCAYRLKNIRVLGRGMVEPGKLLLPPTPRIQYGFPETMYGSTLYSIIVINCIQPSPPAVSPSVNQNFSIAYSIVFFFLGF